LERRAAITSGLWQCVGVKRCLCIAVLLMLLTSCDREPPPYASKYVEPTTSDVVPTSLAPQAEAAAQPVIPPQASFFDNFDRPDTQLGLGEGWDLRGNPDTNSFPLPAATDGFIKDGRFTYNGINPVYAVRQFEGSVRSVGTVGRFREVGSSYAQTAFSMSIVPNDQILTDMLTFVATRSGWNVKIRRANGPFDEVAQGDFSPALELDRDYQFELRATDSTVTVQVPGSEEVTKDVSTAGLLGNRASFQEHPVRTPTGDVFDFNTVWATEDGKPLVAVPADG
jgi:hypothetical protein